MLFEFSIAKKYLIPKKRQLSLSLIALMSVGVISLVVWLILVFLSVTDGIEKTWLKKLTSLNAPIQITPTDAYYQSYYYHIDEISGASSYTLKSIGEKAEATRSDPYAPDEDLEVPYYWPDKFTNPDGSLKDLVKTAFQSVESLNRDHHLVAQDYEVSGALLKLRMIRPQGNHTAQSYLIQVSYINSLASKNPRLHTLIEAPRTEDLNHLFTLAELSHSGTAADQPDLIEKSSHHDFQRNLSSLLENMTITKVKCLDQKVSHLLSLLPENVPFKVQAYRKQGRIAYLMFSSEKAGPSSPFEQGTLVRRGDTFQFTSVDGKGSEIELTTPVYVDQPLTMDVELRPYNLHTLESLSDLTFNATCELQGHELKGIIPWDHIAIESATLCTTFDTPPKVVPPWPYWVNGEAFLPKVEGATSVILPKNTQNNGAQMGDRGYFSYQAATTSSVQEQRLPIYISGFYDPGVMAIGARVILTTPEVVHTINTSTQTHTFDKNMVNGIQLWFDDLDDTAEIQAELIAAFDRAGILPYWNITSFYEYEFAKDLLQQFQSDKYLFTMIAVIVLIVACSNIISLLVILVNDKKREIAILSAMGASKRSIAMIFTLCGGLMGTLSTLIGTAAALLTIHNIDSVVHFLSFLQGHDAFNAMFYGKSLPSELSERALTFILIATPIISLLAGLVPALKANKVHPSNILRSD